jgi:hypothetical protein
MFRLTHDPGERIKDLAVEGAAELLGILLVVGVLRCASVVHGGDQGVGQEARGLLATQEDSGNRGALLTRVVVDDEPQLA